jgi:predicted nucleic acid-binding protein
VAVIVLDASVVVAHLDASDSLHSAAVSALDKHADDDLRVPASVYAEALVAPAREGRLDDARREIAGLGIDVVPIDGPVAERAALLGGREPALKLPDALVLACGDVLDAHAVVTADRRWQRFERVELIA